MNEWAVVGVVITLATFFIAISKPLLSLTKAITHLTDAVGTLQKSSEEQKEKARKSHKELWEHNDKQDMQIEANKYKLAEHETKLKYLEGGKK